MSDIEESEKLFDDDYLLNCSNPMTGIVQCDTRQNDPFFTLSEAIYRMENRQVWTYGVLTLADETNGASVLICVKEGNYYIFDSHSRDRYGNVVSSGTSVLLHFRSANGVIRYIRNVANQLRASQFELVPLSPITVATDRMLQSASSQRISTNSQTVKVSEDQNLDSKRKRVDSDKSENGKEKKPDDRKYTKQQPKKTRVTSDNTKCRRITRSQSDKERTRREHLNSKIQNTKYDEKSRRKKCHETSKKSTSSMTNEHDTNEDVQVRTTYNTRSQSSSQPVVHTTNQDVNVTSRRITRSQTSSQPTARSTNEDVNSTSR